MQVDLCFHLSAGQIVEELQEDDFEQRPRILGRAPIAATVAVAHQAGEEAKIHGGSDPAEQMVCGQQAVIAEA